MFSFLNRKTKQSDGIIYEEITKTRPKKVLGRSRRDYEEDYACLVCGEWLASKELRRHATREASRGDKAHQDFIDKHTTEKTIRVWNM